MTKRDKGDQGEMEGEKLIDMHKETYARMHGGRNHAKNKIKNNQIEKNNEGKGGKTARERVRKRENR